MSDKRRLQELFEKYDASGDGVLSEKEMLNLFEHLGISRAQAEEVFQEADANRDGTIQVHEFISWLTANKPSYSPLASLGEDGTGNIEFAFGNSTQQTLKYTFKFMALENVEVLGQNPIQVVLEPGKRTFKPMLRVTKSPFSYEVAPVCCRGEVNNGEDDLSKAFMDPDFPHDERSTKNERFPELDMGRPDRWVRARMLGNSKEAVLFDQVRPQDVIQGHVGDCYLLASLAALAQQPERLKSLFGEKHITEDGKYTVRLFHIEKKEWVKVTVDEFVPCRSVDGILKPCCAQPLGEEIWVPLLEKAIAKFCGNYGEIYGGMESWVFNVLTGRTPEILQKTNKGWVSYFSRDMKAREPQKGRPRRNRDRKPMDSEQLFQYISGALADKHIVSCSVNFLDDKPIRSPEVESQVRQKYGVEANHAYSLRTTRIP
ncbi:unnamed protein product [Cladocopium goreaui]|uniref:Lipase maturation factor 1 n=1 Tax=Cladocopium goreaui TaxID=2562237 RepID=A0A9P1DSF9_9DINO|nr:unnamed protein product [Cladocopium goreaui]